MRVACLGEAGFPLGWNVKELVVSIVPALVTMQVLKQQGRWSGVGGVYGGYPVSSCYEAPARPVAGGVRIAPVSYAPSARAWVTRVLTRGIM